MVILNDHWMYSKKPFWYQIWAFSDNLKNRITDCGKSRWCHRYKNQNKEDEKDGKKKGTMCLHLNQINKFLKHATQGKDIGRPQPPLLSIIFNIPVSYFVNIQLLPPSVPWLIGISMFTKVPMAHCLLVSQPSSVACPAHKR